MLYYNVLYNNMLYYNVLYNNMLYYNVLYNNMYVQYHRISDLHNSLLELRISGAI